MENELEKVELQIIKKSLDRQTMIDELKAKHSISGDTEEQKELVNEKIEVIKKTEENEKGN